MCFSPWRCLFLSRDSVSQSSKGINKMLRECRLTIRRPLLLLSSTLLFPLPLFAQNAPLVVTLAATGPTPAAQAVSRKLLTGVQDQLRIQKKVNLKGDVLVADRTELSSARLFDYMKSNGADGSAVLDFVPDKDGGFGFAHLTVITPATASAAAAAPPAGRGAGPAPEPARTTSRAISEYLNPSAVKPWQFANFASFITERISGGREIRVLLWVYVRPRGSMFSVGGSDPVSASEPGRSDDEGFYPWVGTRPQGITTVEVSNMPNYESTRRQIDVPNNPDRKFESYMQVILQRRP